VEYSDLHATRRAESSASIRQRVVAARTIEWERLHRHGLFCNAQMNHSMIKKYCRLEREAESLLEAAFHRINLSVRSHDRIIKVARTIADLAQSPAITAIHIAEAIQLRSDVGLNIE
jgi:Predicted ATPase with chaperone activity